MGRKTNCPFCGKEIDKGFLGLFGTTEEMLELGEVSIFLCGDCEKKYHQFAKEDNGRFGIKVDNIESTTKNDFKNEDLAKLFLEYYSQAQNYTKNGRKESYATQYSFYDKSENGYFWPLESLISSISSPSKFASSLVEKVNPKRSLKSPNAFTKDDISMIEYSIGAIEETKPDGFKKQHTAIIEIKLNDYKTMTYKPCFVRDIVNVDKKGMFSNKVELVNEEALKKIVEFRQHIGAEDIPITRVENFD